MKIDIYFILDEDHNAIAVDRNKWSEWYKNFQNRQVAEDFLLDGLIRVSTICDGQNLRLHPNQPSKIFETMVFMGGEFFGQRRYSTWDEALAGHKETVSDLSGVKQVQI